MIHALMMMMILHSLSATPAVAAAHFDSNPISLHYTNSLLCNTTKPHFSRCGGEQFNCLSDAVIYGALMRGSKGNYNVRKKKLDALSSSSRCWLGVERKKKKRNKI
jgi:hypothetical protein